METLIIIIQAMAFICLGYKIISTAYEKNIDAAIAWTLSLIYFTMLILKP